jgi:hypothetical protein
MVNNGTVTLGERKRSTFAKQKQKAVKALWATIRLSGSFGKSVQKPPKIIVAISFAGVIYFRQWDAPCFPPLIFVSNSCV